MFQRNMVEAALMLSPPHWTTAHPMAPIGFCRTCSVHKAPDVPNTKSSCGLFCTGFHSSDRSDLWATFLMIMGGGGWLDIYTTAHIIQEHGHIDIFRLIINSGGLLVLPFWYYITENSGKIRGLNFTDLRQVYIQITTIKVCIQSLGWLFYYSCNVFQPTTITKVNAWE